ncbi:unnamed protein product [Caenorhabditis sp. 36 PRJEB53466]|nr:unnamed protein product [Caenorhabditis sp. 36 PRJEB53466]
MEDFVQLIVKCFPIATFILVVSLCSNRSTEIKPNRARKLTISTTTSTLSAEDVTYIEESISELTITEAPPEDRQVACGNKKDQKEKSEDATDPQKKKEEFKTEQEYVLDDSNSHFAFLLVADNRTDMPQMVVHARAALEQTAAFQWTMKKRLSFDEGCWKHLSRRISAIKAEGFEVRVNTRKARENKLCADRETKIDQVFAKLQAGKPNKKKGGL